MKFCKPVLQKQQSTQLLEMFATFSFVINCTEYLIQLLQIFQNTLAFPDVGTISSYSLQPAALGCAF